MASHPSIQSCWLSAKVRVAGSLLAAIRGHSCEQDRVSEIIHDQSAPNVDA